MLMLRCNLGALRPQWKHVKGDGRYEEAYKVGIRFWQDSYGDRLGDEIRAQVKERDWKQALRGMLVLLRYYPRGLTLLLLTEQRIEWRRFARQLQKQR
jgi:hypothetical protein